MSEKTTKTTAPRRKFRALVGIMYGPQNIPVEAGEVTDSLPPESLKWLQEQGHIVLVDEDEEEV